MTFGKSFTRTVSSLIRNFMPWGGFASLASAFVGYQIVSSNWPGLSDAKMVLLTIPVAIGISVVGFLTLATLLAMLLKTRLDGK